MKDKFSRQTEGLHRLYRQLSGPQRRGLFGALAVTILGAIAEIATIGAVVPYVSIILNAGTPGNTFLSRLAASVGQLNFVFIATLAFAALAVGAAFTRVFVLRNTTHFVFRLGGELGAKIFDQVLHKPLAFHLNHNSADVMSVIGKAGQLTSSLILPLMLAIASGVIALGIVASLLVVSPLISLISLVGFGAIYFFYAYLTKSAMSQNSQDFSSGYSMRTRVIQEGLGSIRDILLDQSQAMLVENFVRSEKLMSRSQANNNVGALSPRYIIESLAMVVIAFCVCILLATGHSLTDMLPRLGAFVLGAQRLLPSMQAIYYGAAQVSGNWAVLLDVLTILEEPSRDIASASTQEIAFNRSISLQSVSFAYGDLEPVLHNVSIDIPKGTKVGFVGRTGCGKSTIMDLVMGLSLPSSGKVLIDGTELCDINIASWRKRIAHVPQSIFLLDGSIRDNILFGATMGPGDEDWLKTVTAICQIDEFAAASPDGLAATVGERGTRLSGGQRQRIGIARALYKRPDVLILDEATSALDEETETKIMDGILALGQTQTILMIAHRLRTLEGCDRIYRLDKGRFALSGDCDNGLASSGPFAPRTLSML